MKKTFSVILACGALTGILIWTVAPAGAQIANPQVLLNWQAATYVPQNYVGKALPVSDSRITVGVDLFDQGRRIDLAAQRINWYLNNNFYQGAAGLTRINFTAPHHIGATAVSVRVSIPDYGNGPGRTIAVPSILPEAVIQTSSPNITAAAAPFSLQAYPYFFNVQNPSALQFLWTLRGARVGSQNPLAVTRQMAEGGNNATMELQIINPSRPIERVTRNLVLFPPR